MELFQPKADTPALGAAALNDPIIHFALATTDTKAATEHVVKRATKSPSNQRPSNWAP